VKFGLTLNYDNRPAVVGKETDYVYVFSIGWEEPVYPLNAGCKL